MRSWPGDHIETLYILYFLADDQDGPYHSDSTASRLLSEVKHCRVELVLRWGTTLESSMFIFCLLFSCLKFVGVCVACLVYCVKGVLYKLWWWLLLVSLCSLFPLLSFLL